MLVPGARVKVMRIVGVVVVIAVLLYVFRPSSPRRRNIYTYTDGKTNPPWQNDAASQGPSSEATYLARLVQKHGLTKDVPWFARRIGVARPSSASAGTPSLADAGVKFMPGGFRTVRADADGLRLRAEKKIRLAAAGGAASMPESVDASSLLFGISTTYPRITYANHSLIADWQRWLTDGRGTSNGATLMLALHHATAGEAADVTRKLLSVGIDVTIVPSEDGMDMTTRYIDLIRGLANKRTALSKEGREKTWLALVDDDVFLPNLGQLLARLARYDPQEEFYVGAPSERSDWVVERNATITYGGGAVFLTPPAADGLSHLPCLEASKGQGSAQWDLLLYDCVSRHTSLDMHVLTSFYSPGDDDPATAHHGATYEAGIPPLTLHHYRNRHRFQPGKAHLVASICGEECFLQRHRFRDDWVLVNGYTISQYPDGIDIASVPAKPTKPKGGGGLGGPAEQQPQQKAEAEPEPGPESDGGPRKATGRLVVDDVPPSKDAKTITSRGRKRTWRFLDGAVAANGEVWQAYVKRRASGDSFSDGDERLASDVVASHEEPSDLDSVIVLIWEP